MAKKKKKGKKKGYPGTAAQRSAKISKVAAEHPELSNEAVVGRALGTMRSDERKRRRKGKKA